MLKRRQRDLDFIFDEKCPDNRWSREGRKRLWRIEWERRMVETINKSTFSDLELIITHWDDGIVDYCDFY